MVIHDSKSAKILKSFGADQSPKGKHAGVYEDLVLPLHSEKMPICRVDRQQPKGTLMSNLANSILEPNSRTLLIASSTVI